MHSSRIIWILTVCPLAYIEINMCEQRRPVKFFYYLSDFIIPVLIFYIIAYALTEKVNVYDEFVTGAADGLKTVLQIMPTLIGLMSAVGMLRASGFLDFVAQQLIGVASLFHFPVQLIPLTLVRLFSSSAATSLALDIYKSYGTDSYIGLVTSIMMGCTETVFYTMSVYFLTAKVTKSRWTLTGALVSTAAGVVASVVLAGMM